MFVIDSPSIPSGVRLSVSPRAKVAVIYPIVTFISFSYYPQITIMVDSYPSNFKPSFNKLSLLVGSSSGGAAAIRPTVGQLFPRGFK